jgi:protein-disulfide isomerase
MARLKLPVTPHDHIRGPADAAVTLLEYGDYECPHCGAANEVVNAVLKHFARELRFVFRHFPLKEVHPNAQAAAESAEFAGARDRFWEMHDGLYQNRERLGQPLLFELARALDLSESDLRKALETEQYAAKIRSDFRGGVRSGVNGTPTFFIDGQRHDGSFAFDGLVAAVEAQLRPKPARQPRWRFWRT